MAARKKDMPMVCVYFSKEEREALDRMAANDLRSVSNCVRVEMVRILRERNLLKDTETEEV